jgi:transposase
MGCFVSETTGLPMFYVTYPGSITDMIHLPYMMAYNDELGITNNVGFVLDRGFCSTDNVQYLINGGYKFILGVNRFHKTTRMAIDFARPCLTKAQHRIESGTYGLSSSGFYYGGNTTMHVFLSHELLDSQMDTMYKKLEDDEIDLQQKRSLTGEEAKKYLNRFLIKFGENGTFTFERDNDKINELAKNFGYFCVLTNIQLDTSEVLAKYRSKIAIENSFDEVKNYNEMKRLRTHKTETTDGKLFCAFLSLITVTYMWDKLRDQMKRKSLSKTAIIRELDKITIGVNDNVTRLLNPFTKRQRTILNVLGLSVEDIKGYLG